MTWPPIGCKFILCLRKLSNTYAICRSFLWCGKDVISRKSPVAWESVCEPRKAKGLNMVDLISLNKATIMKLMWNLQAKVDRLWVQWLYTHYLMAKTLQHGMVQTATLGFWKKMISYRIELSHNSYWQTAKHKGEYKTKLMY